MPYPALSTFASPTFAVTITDAPQEVVFGTSMTVDYRIDNLCEDVPGTRDVEFTIGDRVEGTDANVELPGGGSSSGSFSYRPGSNDIPQFTVGVRIDESADSATVTLTEPEVKTANFGVSITSTNTPVTEGQTVQIVAEVSNSGEAAGDTDVTFEVDGTVVDSREVSLGRDETIQVDGFWETAVGDAGSHDVVVSAAEDNDTRTITIDELPPAEFRVEITDTNAPVEER